MADAGPSSTRPSLAHHQTRSLSSSGSTSSTRSNSSVPDQGDVDEVQTFLSAYRDGEMPPDAMPAQPRALHHGGRVSRWVKDKNLAQSAKTFEKYAYLRAPTPLHKRRLHALRRLDLPTSARTAPGLQQIVDLAASLLAGDSGDEVHAFVSIVDDETQTIVAITNGGAVPVGHTDEAAKSLCAHAILADSTFTVPDLQQDWRFANNDYAVQNIIRSYAGTPIGVRTDTDRSSVDCGGAERRSARLERVGALCIYTPSETRTYTDEDLAVLADCAELVGTAIEASYAMDQCRREEAIRRSVCDLLNLPLEIVGTSTGGSVIQRVARGGSDTPSAADTIVSSGMEVTDSAGPGPISGPMLGTAFDAAAAALCEHLHADRVAIVDPAPSHGSVKIVGRSHPFATRDWPNDRLAALIEEVVAAAPAPGEAVYSAPEAPKLQAREGIVPTDAACMAMPIRDLEGQARLVILAISRNADILFGTPERSYASLIGLTLLGCLAVESLLLSSNAAASFVSQVSGELRLPLHVLTSSLETLREQTPVDALPTLDPLLSTAETCLNSLRNVLEDVLDFNKAHIDGIGNATGQSEVDLATLTSDVCVVGSTRYVARDDIEGAKDISAHANAPVTLEIEDRPASDWIVETSPAGLQRVLLNLLSNAAKATPPDGSIHVRLALGPPMPTTREQDRETVGLDQSVPLASASFTITDTGVGMTQQFIQSQLFEPFVQGAGQGTGAGLGASLARQIVGRLGGTITVSSVVNQGTTMEVRIPVRLQRGHVGLSRALPFKTLALRPAGASPFPSS